MQGNPDIDVLMIPTSKAIKKHVKDRDAITEIYNRAYEAVMISMEAKEAENAALREQLRWIPVSERLPENKHEYLVRYLADECIYYSDAYYVEEVKHWFSDGRIDNVTHWLPIPPIDISK